MVRLDVETFTLQGRWMLAKPISNYRGRLSTTNGLQSWYTVYPTETEIAADRMNPSAAIVIKIVRLWNIQSISASS